MVSPILVIFDDIYCFLGEVVGCGMFSHFCGSFFFGEVTLFWGDYVGNVGICGGLHISRMVVEMLEIRVSSEVRSF